MIFLDSIFHLALLVALSLVAGLVAKRRAGHGRSGALWQGMLFGGAAVLSMLRPLELGSGLVLDGRSLLVSLCALFFGPWAAAAAVVLTVTGGIGLGGVGMPVGLLVILSSAAIGLLAHVRRKPEAQPPSTRSLYLFGLAVHLAMLMLMLALPGGAGLTAVMRIGLSVLLLYPLATIVAGKTLSDQLRAAHVEPLPREKEQRSRQLLDGANDAVLNAGGTGETRAHVLSARQPAAAELPASKVFLNTLLDAIPVPVFYKDRDGRYLGCNRTYETFFGSKSENLVGKTVFEVHPPELAKIYHARDTELFESGGVQQYESEVRDVAGQLRNVIINKAVFSDDQGAVGGLIGTVLDITERKETEQRLRESEKRLRLTLEATQIGIWDWDVTNDQWYASPIYYTMLGYEPRTGLGDRAEWLERVHPDDRAQVAEKIQDVLTRDFVGYQYEARMRHADGSYRWHQVMGFGIERDQDGNVTRMLGTRMDISERKRAEQERLAHLRSFECMDRVNRAILEANELEQMMVNVLKTVLSIFDCDRTWLFYPCDPDAPTFRVPVELTRPEYPGAKALNVDIPMSPDIAQDLREALASEDPVVCIAGTEKPINQVTAEQFGVQSQMFVALHPKLGEPWVFGMHQCSYPRIWTGEEKRLLQEIGRRLSDALTSLLILGNLKESEEKTRSILDNIGIGVALISPEMRILELNPRMREWFPDIDPGQHPVCFRAFNDPPRETMCDYCPTCKTLQDGLVHEATTQTPQAGGLRNYRIVSSPIRNASGEVAAAIEIVEDITEKLSLELQLRQAQKLESVGRLAGGVAHDFNNMLGVILGNTELAMSGMDSSQPLFAALQEIQKAAERSADLTRQLLAFARKQTVAPKVLDLNEAVEGMLKMLRRLIGEDIDLVWLPGKNVWPVKVDPSQIDQMLANLCVNARDAIAGVGKVTIEVENTTFDAAYCADHSGLIPGDFVMLAVSDDGHGMDKDTLDKVFEPFFTTKGVGRGTGLGLATVYGAVKQNNGFINVYSEPGHGTTFKIYLPRHLTQSEQRQEEASAAPIEWGYETILLVEDEAAILNMTRRMLERLGYRVLPASTPGEAIRVAREHAGEVHLLLADVVMPEMNGRDLAQTLSSRHPGIKRLFMSGYTANVIAHHGVLDEGITFIQKPFSIQALAAKVRQALKDHADLG